ncbi:MAG: M28 family peptidase [Akkermansiaceae bacterium]|nr:M28 family peptidase [Akkermansiaceae bacterium]
MKHKLVLGCLAAVAVAVLVVLLLRGGSADAGAGESARAHTAAILAFGPRPPGSPALDKVRAHLAAELKKHGWVTRTQAFTKFTPKGRIEFANLIARHAGPGPPDDGLWERPVRGLLAAHIDSKWYDDRKFLGADDAASAAGLILTLAAEIAERPADARQLELVFFDGEEAIGPRITPTDGLYGSRYYAAQWTRRDQLPAFGILLDMVGHRNLQIAYPSDSPPELVEVLTAAAAAEKVSGRFRRSPAPILDDHVPLNNVGIPTIDIIGDFAASNWWHTHRDNLDLISPESLAITAAVVRRMLGELLE